MVTLHNTFHKLKLLYSIDMNVNMYLIFVLNRSDVLPYDDVAFLQAYKWLYNARKLDKQTIIKNCHKWKPYSSIASRYLYKALDTGLVKKNIKEFLEEL